MFVYFHQIYAQISKLPGIKLGETRYHKPGCIKYIEGPQKRILQQNIKKYLMSSQKAELHFRNSLPEQDCNIVNLPVVLGKRSGRLLRYPILLKNKQERDRSLKVLQQYGLGSFKIV